MSERNITLEEAKALSVYELELSVRAANCLERANIKTLYELTRLTEADMLKYRNLGKKSLTEIKAILVQLGLNLGMKDEDYRGFGPKCLEEVFGALKTIERYFKRRGLSFYYSVSEGVETSSAERIEGRRDDGGEK